MTQEDAYNIFQANLNTDEEWAKFLQNPGLLIIDIYSGWCGPCKAIVSTLKVKLEIAGEWVKYAAAKTDNISALERFRGKCEPKWMFVQNGEMVNFLFGVDRPNMLKTLKEELKRVQTGVPPKWSSPATQPCPKEEEKLKQDEAIRQEKENQKKAEEDKEKAKYESFMNQMMFELCEETAIVLYPWVFLDKEDSPIDKNSSVPYVELVREVLPEYFDIDEEVQIHLDDETVGKMFVESDVVISEDLIQGLTAEKCMVIRLKGKPPHSDWPVPYGTDEPETEQTPKRQIDDVENYLLHIVSGEPSSTHPKKNFDKPFIKRHVFHKSDVEIEDDGIGIYPAIWVPPQARSKVHVFKTIFGKYMEEDHPYVEPVVLLPLCGFKYDFSKFDALNDAYENHKEHIKYFGAFENDNPNAKCLVSSPEDFENKVKYKSGKEIFIVIFTKTNDEVYQSFVEIEPYFANEDNDEVLNMIKEYFSEESKDTVNPGENLLEEENDEEEEENESEEEAYSSSHSHHKSR